MPMYGIFWLVLSVALMCCACAKPSYDTGEQLINAAPQEQLIVYTSHKEEVYMPIIREFEERTGIWVDVHAGGTAEIFSEVEEHIDDGICDVLFGGGIESYEGAKEILQPYVSSEADELVGDYCSAEGYWTPFTALPIVFVFNNRLLSGEEAPAGWDELLNDPKWKGRIAFADPFRSGTSYTILSTIIQLSDSESGISTLSRGQAGVSEEEVLTQFITQLDGHLLGSSGDILTKVSDGDYTVGITLEETALKYMAGKSDISMYYPAEGTCVVPDGCAVVRNAPHSYNAGLFIDFIAGRETQTYAMEQFKRRSVRTDMDESPYFEEVRQIDFDIYRAGVDEDRVLGLWHDLLEDEK